MTTNQAGDAADWGPDSGLWEAWSRSVIQNRLAQHARGIDRADEALLREAYHDDGTVDYGSLQGSAAEFAAAIAAMHDVAKEEKAAGPSRFFVGFRAICHIS